jgi:hypothetical protein
MFNGYFSLPPNTSESDIEDDALCNLSLACTESHSVYLSEFPEKMTIYRGTWHPSIETHQLRQVRCNPATDTLLVKEVPSYYSEQRHPSSSLNNPEDIFHQAIKEWYPQRPDVFASFRYLTSRFRHVEFTFMGDTFASDGSPLLFSKVFDEIKFRRFLVFFERLEHLYLCSKTKGFTAVREWRRVEDIKDSHDAPTDNTEGEFVGVSNSVLNCDNSYQEFVQVQSGLSPDSAECCWVPTPKGFGGNWLFCSRGVLEKNR